MARPVNQVLWAQWRQRLEVYRECGLSIAAFCRKEGISEGAFYAWKQKLHGFSPGRKARREAISPRTRQQRIAIPQRRTPASLTGSPTDPTPSAGFLQLPVRGPRSSPWIELSLVDGTLVRVPQENLAALTLLLRVLRGDQGAELGDVSYHA